MHRSRFALIASIAATLACSAAAVVTAFRETVDRSWYGAIDALEPTVAFFGSLIVAAFPPSPRTLLETIGFSTPRTLGGPQTRSFRSRWLARQTDGRARAPLAAAFVSA